MILEDFVNSQEPEVASNPSAPKYARTDTFGKGLWLRFLAVLDFFCSFDHESRKNGLMCQLWRSERLRVKLLDD